ncbi:flagellar motor switch protein FliN [Rhodosalinus sediminis]|jgi:flagellar motor switch protein FliN/FliY|uniref:Flagellar motor switch protein FliN n=2 Tax=Rhodosalinus sediminis TaxID=1940533 RepID=A0A3D9BXY3_9RHOB|nr:flagellar motor switch protein FliN [Rhodosalinus sediminis]REC58364.1 flagellar motor switch protein FliN [Rhodosalinus sediminis]
MSEQNESLETAGGGAMAQLAQLDDIKLRLSVEVGRTELTIREVLDLKEGSVVELDRLAGDPLDIFANGTMIARGEVVVAGERFGIRFSQVVDPAERTPED